MANNHLLNFVQANPLLQQFDPEEVVSHMYQQNPAYAENFTLDEFKSRVGFDEYNSMMTGAGTQASVGEIASTISGAISTAFGDVVPETVGRIIRGGDVPLRDGILGEFITEQQQEGIESRPSRSRSQKRVVPFSDFLTLDDLHEGITNLGYSAPLGIGGFIAGQAAAPVLPIIGGIAGAGTATFGGAYRTSKDQFIQSMRDNLLRKKPDMSEEEWGKIKETLEEDATLFGLYEAAPEAVGNMITAGIIKTPVGQFLKSVPFIKEGVARTLASAGIKVSANIAEELLTEGYTALKQSEIEAKRGLRDEPLATFGEAINEVAPAVTVMAATMQAGGGILNRLATPVQDKLEDIIRENTEALALLQQDELDVIVQSGGVTGLEAAQFEEEDVAVQRARTKQRFGIDLTEEDKLALEETTIPLTQAQIDEVQRKEDRTKEVERFLDAFEDQETPLPIDLTQEKDVEKSAEILRTTQFTPAMMEAERVSKRKADVEEAFRNFKNGVINTDELQQFINDSIIDPGIELVQTATEATKPEVGPDTSEYFEEVERQLEERNNLILRDKGVLESFTIPKKGRYQIIGKQNLFGEEFTLFNILDGPAAGTTSAIQGEVTEQAIQNKINQVQQTFLNGTQKNLIRSRMEVIEQEDTTTINLLNRMEEGNPLFNIKNVLTEQYSELISQIGIRRGTEQDRSRILNPGASQFYFYDPAVNEIVINPDINVRDVEAFDNIILHETIHGLTARELLTNNKFQERVQSLFNKAIEAQHKLKFIDKKEAIQVLMESPLYSKFDPKTRLEMVKDFYHSHGELPKEAISYGLQNINEFITQAFTSKDFQNFLRGIKAVGNQSLWNRFVAAIQTALGLGNIKNTLLSDIIDLSSEIMEGQAKGKAKVVSSKVLESKVLEAKSIPQAAQKRAEKIKKIITDGDKSRILKAVNKLEQGKTHRAKQNISTSKKQQELRTHIDFLNRSDLSHRKIPEAYRKLKAWSLTMSRILDEIDDFKSFKGLFHETFYRPIQKATSKTMGAVRTRKNKVTEAMKKYGVDVNELISKQETTDGHKRSKQQMMYIWLGQDNLHTSNIMKKNMGVIQEEIDYIDKNLTSNEKAFAKALQKDLESAYHRVADTLVKNFRYIENDGSLTKSDIRKLRSVYRGYNTFTKVENYLPMWTKGADISITPDNLAAELEGQTALPYGKGGTIAKNFVYERAETHGKAIDLDLFNIWERAVNMQEHFINLAEPMKVMEQIFAGIGKRSGISKDIGKSFGGSYEKSFNAYFDRVKNPNFYKSNRGLDRLHRALRRNISLAYLGYNLVTGFKQVPSMLYYLPYTSGGHFLGAIQQMTMNPKAVINFAQQDPQMKERVMERYLAELDASEFEKTWDKQLSSKFGKIGSKGRNLIIKKAMIFIRFMDMLATSTGYKAVYDFEMSKVGVTEEQARARALDATVSTQPAAHPKDISQLYAHNEWLNHFLMFSNQLNKIWNMGIHTVVDQTIARKGKVNKDQATTMAVLALGAASIYTISRGFVPPEDPLEYGEAAMEGAMASFPLMGRWVQNAYAGFPTEIPIAGIPTKTMTAIKDSIKNGKVSEKEWFKFSEAFALATGLPYSQSKRVYKAIKTDDVRQLIGIKPTTKSERRLTEVKEDIIKWKQTETPEGRERDLRPLGYQIIEMERLGDREHIVKKLTNRYFAMARKNKVSPIQAKKILNNLRKKAGKQLKSLLSPKDWRGYLNTLSPEEMNEIRELQRYVKAIDHHYYRN